MDSFGVPTTLSNAIASLYAIIGAALSVEIKFSERFEVHNETGLYKLCWVWMVNIMSALANIDDLWH